MQCENISHENHGADNEVRRTTVTQTCRPQRDWREELAHDSRHENTPKHDGVIELSDFSLSADACARDVPQYHRSQDVHMTHVRYNDVVQSLEVQPYSKQHEKPVNKVVLGKHGVYNTISRRVYAYTGLAKDEITKRRTTFPKSGAGKRALSEDT